MKKLRQTLVAAVLTLSLTALATVARAEVTAKISNVHLCCKACNAAVEKAVSKVEGAKAMAAGSEKEGEVQGTVTVTADNNENLQKAVDAIAAAGFHGKIDNKDVKFKSVKFTTGKENVKRVELAGVHNCCPACTKAMKAAIGKVKGVKSDTLEPKKDKFVVEGDFDPNAVVKALNKAGFHASLPKEKEEKEKSAKS